MTRRKILPHRHAAGRDGGRSSANKKALSRKRQTRESRNCFFSLFSSLTDQEDGRKGEKIEGATAAVGPRCSSLASS